MDLLRERILQSHEVAGQAHGSSGAAERCPAAGSLLLLAGGGLLAGVGLFKLLQVPRSWAGLLATGVGGALLLRGWREWLQQSRGTRLVGDVPEAGLAVNPVDEALWESFPASDPPAPRNMVAW
jgi:hypothetical protein